MHFKISGYECKELKHTLKNFYEPKFIINAPGWRNW